MKKKFPWIVYVIGLFVILLVAGSPMISVLVASGVANANGCSLDEGSQHPCVIGGHDYGEHLMTMFVLGWLMFLTFPAGALAFLILLAVLLVHRAKWRKRGSVPSSGLHS